AQPLTDEQLLEKFKFFHAALPNPESLTAFEKGVAEAMKPFEQYGLLAKLPKEHADGNKKEIIVEHTGKTQWQQRVKVSDVLIGGADALQRKLTAQFGSTELAERAF